MQIRSASVYPHPSPTKKPLLSRLWWVSVAPLGKPVVPDVYWMLIGSSADSWVSRSTSSQRSPARRGPPPTNQSGVTRPAGRQHLLPLGLPEEQDLAQVGAAATHPRDHRAVVA